MTPEEMQRLKFQGMLQAVPPGSTEAFARPNMSDFTRTTPPDFSPWVNMSQQMRDFMYKNLRKEEDRQWKDRMQAPAKEEVQSLLRQMRGGNASDMDVHQYLNDLQGGSATNADYRQLMQMKGY